MKRILITIFLAITAWIYLTNIAYAEQQNLNEAIFINYEQFHKVSTSHPTSQSRQKQTVRKGFSLVSPIFTGRHYSVEEVQELIKNYSAQYGINAETPLCIAKLESGYNQFSTNNSSSASGVFQYLFGTWKATDEGKIGLSVYDASANVKAAIKYMAIHKSIKPWTVHTKCPALKFL